MILTTLSFDGTHVIDRCAECGAQTSIDSRAGRGIQLLKHDAFVREHERCSLAAEQRDAWIRDEFLTEQPAGKAVRS